MLARIPPTERWPFSVTRPAAFAPFRKGSSSAGSASVNGTFIHDRQSFATGLR